MSLINRVKNWFKKPQPKYDGLQREERGKVYDGKVRRFENAQTTRLNSSQWGNVQNRPINEDLSLDLKNMRARARHLLHNNPMVKGVVDSYAIDLVGKSGPSLHIDSENERFARVFRDEVWLPFWENLEVTGLSGQQLLMRLVKQDFWAGDWCQQVVDLSSELPGSSLVASRLLDIAPDRLETPWDLAGDPRVTLGVRRDQLGRPTTYYVRNVEDQFKSGLLSGAINDFERINVDEFLHVFESIEPGQVRGVPRLQSVLQEMMDLQDYDFQVLDAARVAANNGFLLHTKDPALVKDAAPDGTTIELRRGQARYITPGYEATQMTPAQPSAQYNDYRHEKLRSLGRIVNMPLLMVLLSAEDSNFSQSRIDLNVIYQRGLNAYQRRIEQDWLLPLVQMANREAALATRSGRFVLPRVRQDSWKAEFNWEPIAHANPKDHATALETLLKLGATDLETEASKSGTTLEELVRRRAKVAQQLQAAGLPTVEDMIRNKSQAGGDAESEQAPEPAEA